MRSTVAASSTIPSPGLRVRSDVKRVILFTLIALVVVGAAPYMLDTFMVNSLTRGFLYAAVALTVDILWGYAGILTFGQSAFFGIGAYAAGLIFTHMGFDYRYALFALGVAIAAGALVAALVGWLSFYQGASPLYASVVTLVLPIVLTQIIYMGGEFTGSSSGLSSYESFDLTMEAWFWIAGIYLVGLTSCAWLFVQSDAGRLLTAIRDNETRCEYLGLNTSRLKTVLLIVMSVIATMAGFIFACSQMVVAPEYAGFVFGTELIIWVALGGRGTLLGPVIGTLLIDTGTAYLSGSFPFYWKLIIGVAFVVVIVAIPRGFMPIISGLFSSRDKTKPDNQDVSLLETTPDGSKTQTNREPHALKVMDVSRHYGSLKVLEGIDFSVQHGELLSLIGPNGAGKTTLMRCLSDGYERSGGAITVNGHLIDRATPSRIVGFGVGRKFQTANVFDTLTVVESLRIARTRLVRPALFHKETDLALPKAALDIMRTTGLDKILGVEGQHLSHGMKQALELAMVLALEPSVLLLDEPTAGLTKSERTMIGDILIALVRDYGLCVLLVEHDLDFVREISSRVIVLHQGRIVLDGTPTEVSESDLVRTIYSGGMPMATI